jgi:hypothetical protein
MTKRRVWSASYERGVELAAAGCPLDYLDALRNNSAAATRKSFSAAQLSGYAQSCVYAFGDSLTGFVIGLRLGTDRGSGTLIKQWNFVPPWPEHSIDWDYEPADVIPKLQLGSYRDALDSRLLDILNNRCLLLRGHPAEGLLCGVSNQPIPDSVDGMVVGNLRLLDDKPNAVNLSVELRIIRTAASHSGKNLRPRAGGNLLDKVDQIPAEVNWRDV